VGTDDAEAALNFVTHALEGHGACDWFEAFSYPPEGTLERLECTHNWPYFTRELSGRHTERKVAPRV